MSRIHAEIVKGNILNISTDAIVLPANQKLKEGSGVSTAIFEAAGRKQLEDACRKYGSCDEGKAVVTSGFDLKSDYIIHTVVPKWIDGKHGEYERLCAAYLAALNVADVLGCESISFPILGSGNNGYSLDLAFEIAYQTIYQFEGNKLNVVYLVVFGEQAAKLVSTRGLMYIEVPDEYIKKNQELSNKVKQQKRAIDQTIAKAGAYLSKKENWDMLLSVAERIVKMALLFR